jgi:hypothetical protein
MSNFFKRWSELKQSQAPAKPIAPQPEIELEVDQQPPATATQVSTVDEDLPLKEEINSLTLEDVAKLKPDSDYAQFMQAEVGEDVHQAAMKKLFTDPHYNIMDGLDIYIDDYSQADPLPAGMLEKMVQSTMLGLFKKEEETPQAPATEELAVDDTPPSIVAIESSQPINTQEPAQESIAQQTISNKGSQDDPDISL